MIFRTLHPAKPQNAHLFFQYQWNIKKIVFFLLPKSSKKRDKKKLRQNKKKKKKNFKPTKKFKNKNPSEWQTIGFVYLTSISSWFYHFFGKFLQLIFIYYFNLLLSFLSFILSSFHSFFLSFFLSLSLSPFFFTCFLLAPLRSISDICYFFIELKWSFNCSCWMFGSHRAFRFHLDVRFPLYSSTKSAFSSYLFSF